jgi:hypothetical protein
VLLWNPLPFDFLNPNRPAAYLTTVGTPSRTSSILAEYLLRLLAEFSVTWLGRYRHTVLRLLSVFNGPWANVVIRGREYEALRQPAEVEGFGDSLLIGLAEVAARHREHVVTATVNRNM